MKDKYTDVNAKTIDKWIEDGWEWGTPISHEEYLKAKSGALNVLLTPIRFVPEGWFGELKGKKILGLASGGGQQMPIFVAHGANCTVLDYSLKQLEAEQIVAMREGYNIEIIRADMTKTLPFEDNSFDIVFHPVSNIYVEKVEPIFKEVYRVLKKGGIFLAGLDNGIGYMVDNAEEQIINSLPFNPLVNEEQMKQLEEEDAGIQFSHTMEEQIGGQLKAGFILTDLLEDKNREGRLSELNIPAYIITRAIK